LARKILLADDSVTAQNMGRKILADAGYEVITVNNGSAALKRIAEIKPNLIVLDVYMPGYSGLEVCQRLKDSEETAHIPVLLTVGKLEPFKAEEARRVRADGHIVKPFEASELLTAITRLEDRMLPQSEGGRFAGESARRSENTSADTGWKSRLGFPSKKKKEDKEDLAAAGSFRDFRKGKAKPGAAGVFAGDESRTQPDAGSDIPRDITPEELDALSALAAKLGGPKPEASTTAAVVEAPAIEVAAEAQALSSAPTDPTAVDAEAPAFALERKSELETPVEHLDAAEEAAAAEPAAIQARQESAHSATQPAENQLEENRSSEIPVAVDAVAVDVASLAQAPAPVDSDDEPIFASAASRHEPESVAIPQAEQTEAAATGDAVEAKNPERQPTALDIQSSNAETLPAEFAAEPVTAADTKAQAMAVPEEPGPSDEELAQALRLLTPSSGQTDLSTIPSHATLVAAGQLLAEEVIRDAASRPRWIAEPAVLTREEASLSLEAEMFRAFSARSAATSTAASASEIEPVRVTGVSAIAAAVESRLAAVGLADIATTSPEQGSGDGLPKRGSETIAGSSFAETSTAEMSASALAAASNRSPVADGNDGAKSAPEKLEVEQGDSSASVSGEAAEEAPAGQGAPATFADAVAQDTQDHDADAPEFENQDTSSLTEVGEAMGKSVKSKSGKSNWHQIHTPQVPTATSTAARSGSDQEEKADAPKAMAAAAAEGSPSSSSSSSSSSSGPDAGTIASIVESVMADLRPKIVEEIVKKLGGK
jgi:CheY-like chemotaxis protein